MVKAVTRPTSYSLCDLDGVNVVNSWHIDPVFFVFSPFFQKILSNIPLAKRF
jgi:hypothetical protein